MKTKEELMLMPLSQLRNIDIQNIEEEKLVQEVVSLKMSNVHPGMPVDRSDVPDIKTREDEEKWQKIIDKRVSDLKEKSSAGLSSVDIDSEIKNKQKELAKVQSKLQSSNLLPDSEKTNQCALCDFVGKNSNGLRLHQKKHK